MKILLLFLFLIPAGAFSQQIIYESDCCDFSFTLDSQWIQIPDDIFEERLQLLTGDYSKLKYEAGFSLKGNQYFTIPYILIQDLSPINLPVDSLISHFASTYTIVESSDSDIYSKLSNAGGSEMVYLKERGILFLVLDITQGTPLKGFTAMMLGGSKRFQINYYSTAEDFEANLKEFIKIVDTVEYN